MNIRIISIVACLSLAGCSYEAQVLETPSFSVVSSYGSKVPGKWLLYVESAALERNIKVQGYVCAAHKYPLQIADAFKTSARQTFANLAELVEPVATPITGEAMIARGARGLIVIRGEQVRPRMEVKPGFWSTAMDSQSLVVASISIDGREGRLLGTTVEGQGNGTTDTGIACEGGAKAIAEATAQAMGDVMRKLGEAFVNSERVRSQ
jgi:hypothetical protein